MMVIVMAEMRETLDIVIPVYNERQSIFANISEIHCVLEDIPHRFVLVDDGSRDDSWAEMCRLREALGGELVTAIRLSRNFGKESALCAGLEAVTADMCVVMDSDLQHPPEMIPAMIAKRREGYNIVECVKASRGKESLFSKVTAKVFYSMMNRFSGFSMDNASDFKLLDASAIAAWRQVGDTNTFFRGMVEWIGFTKAQLPFEVQERHGGQTKFSTLRLVRLALHSLVSFSAAPLYMTMGLGFIFLLGAIVLGVQTLYNKFAGIALDGFSTVILLLLIVGGAILFCLGIIGVYISKIYDEVKKRPRYIVKERL